MADSLVDGYYNPSLVSGAAFYLPGDSRIGSWIREQIQEGERVNRSDPAFSKADEAMDYVLGKQLDDPRPTYLPNVIVNQTKKAIRTHRSALTDLKPVFGVDTFNEAFKPHAAILDNLSIAWYCNTLADRRLGDAISYALAAGTADILISYNPHFPPPYYWGDIQLEPRDFRDTLPINPSRDESIQTWGGVIFREAHTRAALAQKYPDRLDAFPRGAEEGKWGQVFTRFREAISNIITPTGSTLDALKSPKGASKVARDIPLYKVYIDDPSVHVGVEPILMGPAGVNWSYIVRQGEKLYPRKRLIVCTEHGAPLFDGPNPFWHGMYPAARLKLDPWPWLFLGLGLQHDLKPIQDAINTVSNDFLSVFSQWVNRGSISDANAVPEGLWKRFDPRRPSWKVKVKATMGPGFQMIDGPQLPTWAFNFFQFLLQKHEDLSGMANLQQLMQLRQMPGADTIEKYYEALTPELREEGRLLEVCLREVGEMCKTNFFQFYSKARRIMILGESAGQVLSDFDFDPGTMVPALTPGDPGYIPELDKSRSRDERAQFFHRLFVFRIRQNSLLAMHAQTEQMKYVQLARQGYMDFWTLMEKLQVPNVGTPPPIPLPVRDWKPEVDPTMPGVPLPPPVEMREPLTITERLQAQQMLGIGMTASPAGRKASGEEAPKMEQKSDGRTTISES